MKVSVCITTFNERLEDIQKLLDSLSKQTLKPDEVVMVDAGSTMTNNQIPITKQFLNSKFRYIQKKESTIAQGRNISIKNAKNEIIAITDVGCIPKKDWLEKLVRPFKIASSQVPRDDTLVAGYYDMPVNSSLQKVFSIYLGVSEEKYDSKTFLPSARSVAFSKSVWKKVGGFNESLTRGGEDTEFFYKCVKNGVKIIRIKEARVVWQEMGKITLKTFIKKLYIYSKGDGEARIWWNPAKHFQSHNIKISLIFLRYLLAFTLLAFGLYGTLGVFIGVYMFYAYLKAGIYGPIIQIVSDVVVMYGFIRGILRI